MHPVVQISSNPTLASAMSDKFHHMMCPSAVLPARISESFDHRNAEVFVAAPHHLAGSAVKLSLQGVDISGKVQFMGVEATLGSSNRCTRMAFPRWNTKSCSLGEKDSSVYELELGALGLTLKDFTR